MKRTLKLKYMPRSLNSKRRRKRKKLGGAEINEGKEITVEDTKEKAPDKEKGVVKSENSIFLTKNISISDNTDPEYHEIGIIHISEPGSVNIAREFITDVANVFGKKGFDRTIYDQIRKKALLNLENLIKDNQKVCNLKIDVENVKANSLFFIHLHGMLLEK